MEQVLTALINNKPQHVTEINLDNSNYRQIDESSRHLLEQCTHLEVLSLNNNSLQSLSEFPKLPSLRMLELANNQLEGNFQCLSGCKNLLTLNLSGNKITNLKELEKLKCLEQLNCLDLDDTPIIRSD